MVRGVARARAGAADRARGVCSSPWGVRPWRATWRASASWWGGTSSASPCSWHAPPAWRGDAVWTYAPWAFGLSAAVVGVVLVLISLGVAIGSPFYNIFDDDGAYVYLAQRLVSTGASSTRSTPAG